MNGNESDKIQKETRFTLPSGAEDDEETSDQVRKTEEDEANESDGHPHSEASKSYYQSQNGNRSMNLIPKNQIEDSKYIEGNRNSLQLQPTNIVNEQVSGNTYKIGGDSTMPEGVGDLSENEAETNETEDRKAGGESGESGDSCRPVMKRGLRSRGKLTRENIRKSTAILPVLSFCRKLKDKAEGKKKVQLHRRNTVRQLLSGEGVGVEQVEEWMQLNHLQKLMTAFEQHQPVKTPSTSIYRQWDTQSPRAPGLLNVDEFKAAVAGVLGTEQFNDQLETLFTKLDTSADGYVDWNEFVTYMLLQLKERDQIKVKTRIPFRTEPRIKHIVHNRQETTSKLLGVDGPLRYVSLSRDGALCVWDASLHLDKHFMLTNHNESDSQRPRKGRGNMWVTDAVYMPNSRKLVIATTGRDLRFYDVTSSQYHEEFYLFGLPDVPFAMDYWCDARHPAEPSMLFFGDGTGSVHTMHFLQPVHQLFLTTKNKKESIVTKVFWPELASHARFVTHSEQRDVHREPVKRLRYVADNSCVMTCSLDVKRSLVVMDAVRGKNKAYVFSLSKGIECFDYSKGLNALVTGSADHRVRVWNPYVTSKPVAVMDGHNMGVVDVKLHPALALVFSYSKEAVLKVWELTDHTCIQTIVLPFPTSVHGRLPEHGSFPMHLQLGPGGAGGETGNPATPGAAPGGNPASSPDSSVGIAGRDTLLLTANDYMTSLRVGAVNTNTSSEPTTHQTQLSVCLYNPYFKQVVTGADDSSVYVWDVESGRKNLHMTSAHGREEVTCLAFDSGWRRLFTGACNGSVKVWNVQNGHLLQQLEGIAECEVTGVVPLSDKKEVLTVGWSRHILAYDFSNPDMAVVKPNRKWSGKHAHNDDILCVAYLNQMLIATASFDGEINVWTLENEQLYLRLRKGRQNKEAMMDLIPRTRTPSSRPNSRPNSRHRKSHRPPIYGPAPVDALLFLPARTRVARRTEAAILISSEAGHIRFWSIYHKHKLQGVFYAASEGDESVLGVTSDEDNTVLVTGDTRGQVTVWDIQDYCLLPSDKISRCEPHRQRSWSAHESAVVGLQVAALDGEEFLITASTDHTAKLWDMHGHCVGMFGQKHSWNIRVASSWLDPSPSENVSESGAGEPVQNDGHMTPDVLVLDANNQPEISATSGENMVDGGNSEVTNEVRNEDLQSRLRTADREAKSRPPSRVQFMDAPVTPGGGSRKQSTTSVPYWLKPSTPAMAQRRPSATRAPRLIPDNATSGTELPTSGSVGHVTRAHTFGGTGNERMGNFGSFERSKTFLGMKVERELTRQSFDRKERRRTVNGPEAPSRDTSRNGSCCPYQALDTHILNDDSIPTDLPMTQRMLNRGYTSASISQSVLRDMDLSFFPPPPRGAVGLESQQEDNPEEGEVQTSEGAVRGRRRSSITSASKTRLPSLVPSSGRSSLTSRIEGSSIGGSMMNLSPGGRKVSVTVVE